MLDNNQNLRKSILSDSNRTMRREPVTVPGLDLPEPLFVREMTASEYDEFEASRFKVIGNKVRTDLENTRARVIVVCCVDGQGKQVFAESDIRLVGELRKPLADAIYEAAAQLNGLGGRKDSDEDDTLKNGRPAG